MSPLAAKRRGSRSCHEVLSAKFSVAFSWAYGPMVLLVEEEVWSNFRIARWVCGGECGGGGSEVEEPRMRKGMECVGDSERLRGSWGWNEVSGG